jgi:hypothetical protein
MVSKENKRPVPRTIRLKSCPRCKGDVVLDNDHYGWYEQCLQCGHISDLPDCVPHTEETFVPARYQREKRK